MDILERLENAKGSADRFGDIDVVPFRFAKELLDEVYRKCVQDQSIKETSEMGMENRFTDNGDGTVTDNLTGLIWLKNANAFGLRTWEQALADANALASGSAGLTDGSKASDWRLPNVNELESLIDCAYYGPALSSASGKSKWTSGDAFIGVQSLSYWSGTTCSDDSSYAWDVDMGGGFVSIGDKTSTYYVWPVRSCNESL